MSWTAADVPDQSGRTVVVTGANSGLGLAATRALARKGATVVMACRSTERGERAAAAVRETVAGADLDVRACDLASLSSVAAFAEGVRADYDALHALCNNAGVMAIPRRETEDGFEYQFGVNHLGHFALTGHLLGSLVETPGETRVVTHASGAHRGADIDFGDLHGEDSYRKWGAYGQSKLANVLFARELGRRLEAAGVTDVVSAACHPGWADTNLQARMADADGSRLKRAGMAVANRLFAQSAADGALPLLYAATAEGVANGDYVGPGGFLGMRGAPEKRELSDSARDPEVARRLWTVSVEETGVDPIDRIAAAAAD